VAAALNRYPESIGTCIIDDDCVSGRKYQLYFSHLSYCGRVARTFKAKSYRWTSQIVDDFVRFDEPMADWTDEFKIVKKNLVGAYNSLVRFDHADFKCDDRLWDIAYDWLYREFFPIMSGSVIYDYDTVREYMVDDTSPGFPMSVKYPTKAAYLKSQDGFFNNFHWDCLGSDDPIITFDAVSIKVELRSKAKVDSDKPRTIIAEDTDDSVAGQRLFLDQNIRMNSHHLEASSCVGLDPYHGGWHRCCIKMSVHPNSFELDGKEYDGRFHNRAQSNICRFRKACLAVEYRTKDNLKRIDNFYNRMKGGFLVQVDGRVYLRTTGETSGNSNTVNDNSLKNRQDMTVLYLMLVPKKYHSFEMFNKHVSLVIVGDDVNLSVSDEILPFFNAKNIIAISSSIGMEYETPCADPRPFHDTSFLSSRFVLRRFGEIEMYVPVLDCVKTKCSMLHGNEKGDVLSLIQRVCNMRIVSFGCVDCFSWFERLGDYIRKRFTSDPVARSSAWAKAWSGWLPEHELVRLYTGIESSPARGFIVVPPEISPSFFRFDTSDPFSNFSLLHRFKNAKNRSPESCPKTSQEESS